MTTTESQSLAQFEIWSCGIPIIVNSCEEFIFNKTIYKSSSSPYLNEYNGFKFNKINELEQILEKKLSLVNNKKIINWSNENNDDTNTSLNLIKVINE